MTEYLRHRDHLERVEQAGLAVFGMNSAASRGRVHSEEEPAYRTAFQRDRDRLVHCAAFRRLEAKTQVFLGTANDYYRTRLTHTIEVAQIARTMARALGVNETLVEAVALGHDLGHPPYGHCGEQTLNQLMAAQGGFEHNRQTLRAVDYLEHPYPAFRGLNLTYETRLCLATHETRYDQPEPNQEFGPGPALIEGQIVDVADMIAYHSHDLDDALSADMIRESDLDEIALYRQARQRFERDYPDAHQYLRQVRCARALIDVLVTDVLTETSRRLQTHQPVDSWAMRTLPERIVACSAQIEGQFEQLSRFLFDRVYRHPKVVQAETRARQEITALFELYVSRPERMGPRFQKRVEEQGAARVACDFLAGMTDRYCRYRFEADIASS